MNKRKRFSFFVTTLICVSLLFAQSVFAESSELPSKPLPATEVSESAAANDLEATEDGTCLLYTSFAAAGVGAGVDVCLMSQLYFPAMLLSVLFAFGDVYKRQV